MKAITAAIKKMPNATMIQNPAVLIHKYIIASFLFIIC